MAVEAEVTGRERERREEQSGRNSDEAIEEEEEGEEFIRVRQVKDRGRVLHRHEGGRVETREEKRMGRRSEGSRKSR